MKKILVIIAMISVFLVPALLAQGKTITPPYLIKDKIKVLGFVNLSRRSELKIHPYELGAGITLYYKGYRITPEGVKEVPIVRMNDKALRMISGGGYNDSLVCGPDFGLGDMINLSIEFPSHALPPPGTPPYSGLMKLASLRIENTIEMVYPTNGQGIDLAAHSLGIRMRWNFTGTAAVTKMTIKDSGSGITVFSREGVGEEITVPAGILQPGKSYGLSVQDKGHFFSISNLFSSSSSIELCHWEHCDFTTKPAK